MAIADSDSLAIRPNVYYTIEEAAKLLRVPSASVRRLLSQRALGVKIGRQWRILGAALLDLSSQQEEAEAAQVKDWLAASAAALREVWDNEADAAYDDL
jgi:excisionase family DNA binding protein